MVCPQSVLNGRVGGIGILFRVIIQLCWGVPMDQGLDLRVSSRRSCSNATAPVASVWRISVRIFSLKVQSHTALITNIFLEDFKAFRVEAYCL